MIEFCSAKQMIFSIIVLGGLTFFVLVIESYWTENNSRNLSAINSNSSYCWLKEEYKIVEECQPCSDFEITSQSNEACQETHYKEAVKCKITGKVYRSCAKVSWIEEKKFWKFETLMFIFGIISSCSVYFRQKVLNRRMIYRIQKQLANII